MPIIILYYSLTTQKNPWDSIANPSWNDKNSLFIIFAHNHNNNPHHHLILHLICNPKWTQKNNSISVGMTASTILPFLRTIISGIRYFMRSLWKILCRGSSLYAHFGSMISNLYMKACRNLKYGHFCYLDRVARIPQNSSLEKDQQKPQDDRRTTLDPRKILQRNPQRPLYPRVQGYKIIHQDVQDRKCTISNFLT